MVKPWLFSLGVLVGVVGSVSASEAKVGAGIYEDGLKGSGCSGWVFDGKGCGYFGDLCWGTKVGLPGRMTARVPADGCVWRHGSSGRISRGRASESGRGGEGDREGVWGMVTDSCDERGV